MEKVNLKPCPFCGGEVRIIGYRYNFFVRDIDNIRYGIQHKNKKAKCCYGTKWESEVELLIKLWNKRSG